MNTFTPGGIGRPLDLRDIKLGAVQEPVAIPAQYDTDISWLNPIWQDGVPACGAHAGTHLKMILDHDDASASHVAYSPNDLWREIKLIDGFTPEVGTDMRSIFKVLANRGVSDYDLMPNVFPTSLTDYTDPAKLTQAIRDNAQPRIIKSYGFGNAGRLHQDVFVNKAALILIDIGNSWWGQEYVSPFTRKDGGHFVVATGYKPDGSTRIVDSADKVRPIKWLSSDYAIRETGTALDLSDEEVRKHIQKLATLQKIVSLMQRVLSLKKLLR